MDAKLGQGVYTLHVDEGKIMSWLEDRGVLFVDVWRCPCGVESCKLSVHVGWGAGAEGYPYMLWVVPSIILVAADSLEDLADKLERYQIKPQLYGIPEKAGVQAAAERMVSAGHVDSLVTYLSSMFPRPVFARA